MTTEPVAYIYALLDPRFPDEDYGFLPRYVGKADNPYKRYRHEVERDRDKTHRQSWVTSLRNTGLKPFMILLDGCEQEEWRRREMAWIQHLREAGYDLTNLTDGGEGLIGYHPTEEARRRMSLAKLGTHPHREPTPPQVRRKQSAAHRRRAWIGVRHPGTRKGWKLGWAAGEYRHRAESRKAISDGLNRYHAVRRAVLFIFGEAPSWP